MITEINIAELVELDKQVDFCEGEGLRQRWLFGRELLERREGKLLPRGLLDELVKQTGKSRTELQYRAQFAAKYPTEEQLSNAIGQFKSWFTIVNEALPGHNHRAQGTGDNEWYTPPEYIEAARKVMGGIDLDPASSDKAQETVQAEDYFTKEDDGLTRKWEGRVWLNPPFSRDEIYPFTDKLVTELSEGNVSEAILLTHNYTDTAWFHLAESIAVRICFTKGRIGFVDENGEECAPTQGQAFFYFGENPEKFDAYFKEFGFIR